MTEKRPKKPLPDELAYEALVQELRNVSVGYPLFPGHALDRRALREIERRRWVVKQLDGGLIPTARGLRVLEGEECV